MIANMTHILTQTQYNEMDNDSKTHAEKSHRPFKRLTEPFPKSAYKEVNLGRPMTVIDAYHIIQRLNLEFGLMGWGWGVKIDEYVERDGFVAAMGCLWYKFEGETCYVQAVGDARIFKGNFAEARKKAQTNLISKATSYMGVGLSVYQGKGIDDPYIDQQKAKEDRIAPQFKNGDWKDVKTPEGNLLGELGPAQLSNAIEWRNRQVSHTLDDDAFRLFHAINHMQKEISKKKKGELAA